MGTPRARTDRWRVARDARATRTRERRRRPRRRGRGFESGGRGPRERGEARSATGTGPRVDPGTAARVDSARAAFDTVASRLPALTSQLLSPPLPSESAAVQSRVAESPRVGRICATRLRGAPVHRRGNVPNRTRRVRSHAQHVRVRRRGRSRQTSRGFRRGVAATPRRRFGGDDVGRRRRDARVDADGARRGGASKRPSTATRVCAAR